MKTKSRGCARKSAKKQLSPSCSPKSAGNCKPGEAPLPKTLSGLVENYLRMQEEDSKSLQSLLQKYSKIERLEDAVTRAIRAEDLTKEVPRKTGKVKFKRHGHQRRITTEAINKVLNLPAIKKIKQKEFESFCSLYDYISKTREQIKGIGPLYIYDTALRIGARMELEPKSVYLHAGARKGAKALGLDVSRSLLSLEDLPESMQRLKPYEVEDFLCIFKDEFRNDAKYKRS